jgi:ComF family protein
MSASSVPWPRWIRERVADALADAVALLLPVACAGCDEPDRALCASCRSALGPRPRRTMTDDIVIVSGLDFDGVAARVIRALKEDGRTSLANALAPALTAAVAAFGHSGAVVVPVPTSRAAYRRRGYRVPETVAARAGIPVARLLRLTRRTADQRGLDRDGRRRNVAGSMRASRAQGLRVLLLDDVVTTGATLAEAARALREGGAEVLGAVTIAATGRRFAHSVHPPDTTRFHA